MNKISRLTKIAVIVTAALSVFSAILFFAIIAPRRTVPILMYHSISGNSNASSVDIEAFTKQMDFLSRYYKVMSLADAVGLLKNGRQVPRDWVVLTFDDGYKDFYTDAYPIIKDHSFKAVIFVYTNPIEKDRDRLTWPELVKLKEDGLVDIGSHSLSHDPLPLLSYQEARKELTGSKHILEDKLGSKAAFFSYPFGAMNSSIETMVKESGYEAAVGIAYRMGEFADNDVYALKRVYVSNMSRYPMVFRFMVSGYYVPTRELFLRILNIKTPRDLYTFHSLHRVGVTS